MWQCPNYNNIEDNFSCWGPAFKTAISYQSFLRKANELAAHLTLLGWSIIATINLFFLGQFVRWCRKWLAESSCGNICCHCRFSVSLKSSNKRENTFLTILCFHLSKFFKCATRRWGQQLQCAKFEYVKPYSITRWYNPAYKPKLKCQKSKHLWMSKGGTFVQCKYNDRSKEPGLHTE